MRLLYPSRAPAGPRFYLPLKQSSHDPEFAGLCRPTACGAGRAVFAPQIRSWTVGAGLFGAAAVLALLLAALGLYAVIAFGVRQRELEFGTQRALGARAADLLRMVMPRDLAVTAASARAWSPPSRPYGSKDDPC